MTNDEKIQQLRLWIQQCKLGGMVFFGGAGVSTESGIPDFRSPDGLYSQKYDYPPEVVVSHSFFMRNPAVFYDFYCERMLPGSAQPNAAHRRLAQLEAEGKLSAVITQNIDGLHQAAGSKNVYELHGSVLRNYCMRCGKFHDFDAFMERHLASDDGVPRCDCGGMLKPDVVLFEESLNDDTIMGSVRAIQNAELLVIAGTSLSVYPAAGLIDYFRGKHLVIINLAPTDKDRKADLCISAKVGEVLGSV